MTAYTPISSVYADGGYRAIVQGNYKAGLIKVGGVSYLLPGLIFSSDNITTVGQQKQVILDAAHTYFTVHNESNLPYAPEA